MKINSNILYFILSILLPNFAFGQTHTFDWATAVHSNGNTAIITSVKTDVNNNVYTLGKYYGETDIDPSPSQQHLTPAGIDGIFITKQSPAGNTIWIKNLDGAFANGIEDLAIDPTNNIYISGYYSGTIDFNPNAGVSNLTAGSLQEFFVLALDTSSAFNWVKVFPSTGDITPLQISIDAGYNILVSGWFTGTCDFDPSAGVTSKTSSGGRDAFALQLNYLGALQWVKTIGGAGNDKAVALKSDNQNNYYFTGTFEGTVDLNPNAGVSNATVSNVSEFVVKLDAGANFVWANSTTSPSAYGVTPVNIEITSNYNVIVSGTFGGLVDFDPSTNIDTLNGGSTTTQLYVQKFDWDGNYINAISFGQINNGAKLADFTIDKLGGIYITGNFSGTMDFDPGFGTAMKSATTGAPNTDSYILKLNEDLSFSWVETVGGVNGDGGESITIASNFSVHSSGYYEATVDFDFSAGTSNLTVNQVNDIDHYVSTISQCIVPLISTQPSSSAVCEGGNITFSIPVIGTNFTPIWQVNSGTGFVNISGAEYYESQFGPNTNLEIYPTPINYNNYQYRLIVTTPCGSDTSSIITLNVQSAPIILSQPSNQSVCRNSSSAFSLIEVIIPGSFYQWYANGNPINDGGIYSGAYSSNLQISSVHDSLAGVLYSCTIMGSCGTTNSDSVAITVLPVYNQSVSSAICNGTSYIFGTQTLTSAGNYTEIFQSTTGCDSVVNLALSMNPSYNQNINASICNGSSYYLGSQVLTASGNYSEIFQSINGCDSIVNLNLMVNTIDTSTTVTGFLITANQTGANYQWLTCNNTVQPTTYVMITGEINQAFTAPSNGNYAIALSQNSCVDTSECISINVIGINKYPSNISSIIVFPNPNNGDFTIEINNNADLKITDVLGKVMYEDKIHSGRNQVSISNLISGIYYLLIKSNDELIIEKISKQ